MKILMFAMIAALARSEPPNWLLGFDPLNKSLKCEAWKEGREVLGRKLPRIISDQDIIDFYSSTTPASNCRSLPRRMSPAPIAAATCGSGPDQFVMVIVDGEASCSELLERVQSRMSSAAEKPPGAIAFVLNEAGAAPTKTLAHRALRPQLKPAKEVCIAIRSNGAKEEFPLKSKSACLSEAAKYDLGKGPDKKILMLIWGDLGDTDVRVFNSRPVKKN